MKRQLVKSVAKSVHSAYLRQALEENMQVVWTETFTIEQWFAEMEHFNKTYDNNKQHAKDIILLEAKSRIFNQNGGALYHLNNIYGLFIAINDHIVMLMYHFRELDDFCSFKGFIDSLHQTYIQLYATITKIAAKAYMIMEMAGILIKKYENGFNYQRVLDDAKKDITYKHHKLFSKFESYIQFAPREVWRCEKPDEVEQNDPCESYLYIYVGKVFSNYTANRVVTGARLVKENCLIYIEIQEGELGPMASIKNNNVFWVNTTFSKNDIDNDLFLKIDPEDSIEIELFNLETKPTNSLLVGLQFVITKVDNKSVISLYVQTRLFNLETGVVKGEEWGDFKQLLSFTTQKPKKLGFDDLEVTTTVPTPMSGAGLYYKRISNSDGLFGLKLLTYDLLPELYNLYLWNSSSLAHSKIDVKKIN